MNSRLPLSILIPTRNEQANIVECIRSCRFAEQVVVVDSASTDRTRELAQELGAEIVAFTWNGALPKKKNWALEHVRWRHEWVFILDADERITPELEAELRGVLARPVADGYYVNRRFWFLDGWLRHCGYYPSWNLRLFRHQLGRYEMLPGAVETGSGDNEVHEHVLLRGATQHLKHEMEHFAFPTIEIWVEKHNRYSNWEARVLAAPAQETTASTVQLSASLARRRWLKRLARKAPCRPLIRFLYHYVLARGFLDGYRGYVFCRLMAMYEFLSTAKAYELARRA